MCQTGHVDDSGLTHESAQLSKPLGIHVVALLELMNSLIVIHYYSY